MTPPSRISSVSQVHSIVIEVLTHPSGACYNRHWVTSACAAMHCAFVQTGSSAEVHYVTELLKLQPSHDFVAAAGLAKLISSCP